MVETQAKRPTDSLANDHVTVIAQLKRLRSASAKLSSPLAKQVEKAKKDITEVAAFLDSELELHLRKEEDALFPYLEAIMGATGGPTAVMRHEHGDLRVQNGNLQIMVEEFADDAKTARNLLHLQGTISHIYDVLTQHIHKEDYILFPMANDALSPQSMDKVAARMRELDARR